MLGGEDGRELNVADVKGVELTVHERVDVPIRARPVILPTRGAARRVRRVRGRVDADHLERVVRVAVVGRRRLQYAGVRVDHALKVKGEGERVRLACHSGDGLGEAVGEEVPLCARAIDPEEALLRGSSRESLWR